MPDLVPSNPQRIDRVREDFLIFLGALRSFRSVPVFESVFVPNLPLAPSSCWEDEDLTDREQAVLIDALSQITDCASFYAFMDHTYGIICIDPMEEPYLRMGFIKLVKLLQM